MSDTSFILQLLQMIEHVCLLNHLPNFRYDVVDQIKIDEIYIQPFKLLLDDRLNIFLLFDEPCG